MNLDYLRRAHTHHMKISSSSGSDTPGPIYWLNTVALEPERVRAYVETEARGGCGWMDRGMDL